MYNTTQRIHLTQFSTVTAATENPVSTTTAKLHMRVTYNDEDTNIATYISAATAIAQLQTNRQFCTATFKAITNQWPADEFVIHKNPVQSVSWVKYYDANNELQTLSTANWQLETINEPATLRILEFPTLYDRPDAVQIQFIAGYGAASTVPGNIISALLLFTAHLFEHRETVGPAQMFEVPQTAQTLLNLSTVPFY